MFRKLLLAVLILGVVFSASALADTYNTYMKLAPANFIYADSIGGTKLASGSKLQFIIANGSIHAPDENGDPAGGDQLIADSYTVGNLGMGDGNFYYVINAPTGSKVYLRAWNSANIATATKYNDSALLTFNNPAPNPPQNWEMASFATNKSKPGPEAPTIISTTPGSNATGVALNQNIIVTFSKAMDEGEFDATIISGNTTITNITWNAQKTQVTLTHPAFAYSTQYTIDVDGKSADGLWLENNPYEWSFTTLAEPQPDAPTITSITWQANENENYVYGTIEINGTNFLAAPGSVTIGGVNVPTGGNGMKIYQWTDTKITCGVPEQVVAGSNINVTATTINGSASDSITVKSRIYGVNPTSAKAGEQITINGSGFGTNAGNVSVTFDGSAGSQISANDTTITVTVPDVEAGEVTLIVNVNGQTASTTFTVEETPLNAPVISSLSWTGNNQEQVSGTLVVNGTKFGEKEVNGSTEVPNAQSKVQLQTAGTSYTDASFYWWQDIKIELGIPTDAVAGPASVKVITENGEATENFDLKATIYNVSPQSAAVGDEVTITGIAFGDNADNVSVTFNGNEAEIISIENGTIVVTVPQMDLSDDVEIVVTVNGVSTTYSDGFEVTDLTPVIGSLSAANGSAEVGQTIIISGENFGDEKGNTSLVRFGTTVANPTAWSDLSIIVAVPQEAGTGEVELTVVTANGEVTAEVNIPGNNIYLDDFEGGSVGTWLENLADSGYYTAGNNVSPDNASISTDGPQAEAKYNDGISAKGMKVKYSNEQEEDASLWGGKLANTLDLSAIKGISLYINWDDSNNAFDLILKDENGIQTKASVSNTSLMGVNGGGYGKLTISVTNFANELGFDWTKVTDYSIMYTTDASSESYHYIDNIIAIVQGEEIETEVKIFSIDPAQAPAGTKVAITGEDFGFAQGQSSLIFENIETNVSYQAEIEKWSASEIKAVVPELAGTGVYNVKVVKIAIAAGIINAQESNTETFKITANAAASGVANVYPNPFDPNNETLTIAYSPGSATNIGIYIYDMTARLVYKQTVSTSQTTWDGRDTWSKLLGDGAYILRVVNEDNKQLIAKGKILVIKQ